MQQHGLPGRHLQLLMVRRIATVCPSHVPTLRSRGQSWRGRDKRRCGSWKRCYHCGLATQRLEALDTDVPELNRIVVAGETEMTLGESLAGMTFE